MKSIQNRVSTLMILSMISFFLAGCDKSKLIHSWADPDAGSYQFSKPIVVAVINEPHLRQVAEEAIVRNIKRVQAYPSYIVLREGELDDVEATKKRLLEDGYDGAVVLRLLDIEDKRTVVAQPYPSYYYNYWGYYGRAWSVATYPPGYLLEERIVTLETTLFSIKDNKLLWVGVSESKDPASVSSLVDEIAEVIGKELREKGIVK